MSGWESRAGSIVCTPSPRGRSGVGRCCCGHYSDGAARWPGSGERLYNRYVSTGGPDLFVICKSCGSEVSPYITECPYCGNRLRKRAPKLDRDQQVAERKARRTAPPLLP